jgi:hypothetical protein
MGHSVDADRSGQSWMGARDIGASGDGPASAHTDALVAGHREEPASAPFRFGS